MPRRIPNMRNPEGRPIIKIDWELVTNLIIKGCNGVQVAAVLDCCADTLYNRCIEENGVSFSDYLREKRFKGDSMIHATQFELAIKKKDRGMLIWLGKNRLGQKDNPDAPIISQEILTQFTAFMEVLQKAQDEKKAQDARNMDDNIQSSDCKS